MTKIIGQTKQGHDIAAWVMKCNPSVYNVADAVAHDGAVDSWSVIESYRLELMKPGDPCVLWVTGAESSPVPTGIHAIGELREAPEGGVLQLDTYDESVKPNGETPPDAERTFAVCHMEWLQSPITRAELLERHPEFKDAEPIRAVMGGSPAVLTPDELNTIRSFDLTHGEVTDEQLDAFAGLYDDDDGDDDFDVPLLYANHPDGSAAAVIYDGDELVALRGDLDTGEGVERHGPFGSLTEACQHVRTSLLSELDDIAIVDNGESWIPVVALEVEGGYATLHRLGENEWAEFYSADDGTELDEPVGYESLDKFFEMLIEDLSDSE